MKTTITIENGKITVAVDDQTPVEVYKPPEKPVVSSELRLAETETLVVPVAAPPVSVTAKSEQKLCHECGTPFTPKTVKSRFCSGKCGQKSYLRKHNAKPKATIINKPSFAKHVPKPEVSPEEMAEVQKVMDEQRANFQNLWDCMMCQNAGDFCKMHESMMEDGKLPPVLRKPKVDVRQ